VFTALDKGGLRFVKYQIDDEHSNGIADPSYAAGPRKVGEGALALAGRSATLTHPQLMKNGILMWLLIPENVGAALREPVPHPTLPDGAAADLPRLDFARATEVAEAEAVIERDGSRFHVAVSKSNARPGITFASPAGTWSMAGLKAVEATVKNTGNHALNVHLAVDGPDADRTQRRNCTITSETIPPGEEKTLIVPIAPVPPGPVAWLRDGQGETFAFPELLETDGYHLAKACAVSVYVYQPGREYTYEVSGLRTVPAEPEASRDR
jgi:hypothetical protein